MLSVPDPIAVGVKTSEQVDWFKPSGDKSHELAGLKLPNPSLENVAWPVGLVSPVVAVSVTVAAHDVEAPTATGEEQETTVVVGSVTTVWVIVAP